MFNPRVVEAENVESKSCGTQESSKVIVAGCFMLNPRVFESKDSLMKGLLKGKVVKSRFVEFILHSRQASPHMRCNNMVIAADKIIPARDKPVYIWLVIYFGLSCLN